MKLTLSLVVLILAPFLIPAAKAAEGAFVGPPTAWAASGGAGEQMPERDLEADCWADFEKRLFKCYERWCPEPETCNEIVLQACVDGAQAVLDSCLAG